VKFGGRSNLLEAIEDTEGMRTNITKIIDGKRSEGEGRRKAISCCDLV